MAGPPSVFERATKALVAYLVLSALGAYILFSPSFSGRFDSWSVMERLALILGLGAPIVIAYFLAFAFVQLALEAALLFYKARPLETLVVLSVIVALLLLGIGAANAAELRCPMGTRPNGEISAARMSAEAAK